MILKARGPAVAAARLEPLMTADTLQCHVKWNIPQLTSCHLPGLTLPNHWLI